MFTKFIAFSFACTIGAVVGTGELLSCSSIHELTSLANDGYLKSFDELSDSARNPVNLEQAKRIRVTIQNTPFLQMIGDTEFILTKFADKQWSASGNPPKSWPLKCSNCRKECPTCQEMNGPCSDKHEKCKLCGRDNTAAFDPLSWVHQETTLRFYHHDHSYTLTGTHVSSTGNVVQVPYLPNGFLYSKTLQTGDWSWRRQGWHNQCAAFPHVTLEEVLEETARQPAQDEKSVKDGQTELERAQAAQIKSMQAALDGKNAEMAKMQAMIAKLLQNQK